jgi:hypothetical protein
MDAKDELIRLTEPHLQWFYGPFSAFKLPPVMPKTGDWIITASVNNQAMIRFNVGQFHSILAGQVYYKTASTALTDMLEWIAAYAFLPPIKDLQRPEKLLQFQTIVPCQIWLHTP